MDPAKTDAHYMAKYGMDHAAYRAQRDQAADKVGYDGSKLKYRQKVYNAWASFKASAKRKGLLLAPGLADFVIFAGVVGDPPYKTYAMKMDVDDGVAYLKGVDSAVGEKGVGYWHIPKREAVYDGGEPGDPHLIEDDEEEEIVAVILPDGNVVYAVDGRLPEIPGYWRKR